MENLRELLNSFTKEDYLNKRVNLHIHTSCSDGEGDYRQIVDSAKEKNYKNVGVMDTQDDYVQKTMSFSGLNQILEHNLHK